jgi:acetyl esterase/lipase
MYEHNIAILKQLIAEHAVIRNVSQHRLPDGTMDVAGNLKIWNTAISRLDPIKLWEQGAPGYDDRDPLQPEPSIVFVPAPAGTINPGTIIVAHGGGFQTRTGCEGMNIASFFHDAGFATAILTYRLRPYTRFDAIADMQRAIRLLRSRRQELGISDKIAVMGFSAGGMLSGNCATHFDAGNAAAADPVERCSCRPDAAVSGYGAFSQVSFPTGFHRPDPMQGETQAERVYLAPEKNITLDTPPFFIWQTLSDDGRLGINLARHLSDIGIPYELHIFQNGVHGLALADGENDLALDIPHVTHWGALCAEWLRLNGFNA